MATSSPSVGLVRTPGAVDLPPFCPAAPPPSAGRICERIDRGSAAEFRTVRLVVAPAAQLASAAAASRRVSVASWIASHSASNFRSTPRRSASPGSYVTHVAAAQIDQLQPPRHHTAQPPHHQRVELHLEQRALGELRPRRLAGLVVDDPHLARRRHIHPVDEPAQLQPRLQHRLHIQLTLGRLQPRRVLQREPPLHQRLGLRQPPRQPLALRVLREQLRQLRPLGQQPLPLARHHRPGPGAVRSAAGASKSRSSTACTTVPRVAAALGFSGSLSITRKRYSSGHCMKSLARDGDSATGGRGGSPHPRLRPGRLRARLAAALPALRARLGLLGAPSHGTRPYGPPLTSADGHRRKAPAADPGRGAPHTIDPDPFALHDREITPSRGEGRIR